MTVAPIVLLGTLVYKLIDTLKQARNKDWNGVVTQVITWVSGVGAVFLVGASEFGKSVGVNAFTLATLSGWGKAIVGLAASSLFSSFHDLTQAIDNTQTNDSGKLTSLRSSSVVPATNSAQHEVVNGVQL